MHQTTAPGASLAPADIAALDFDKAGGLLPAIVQHAQNGAVLMLGYMNAEALRETLTRRRVVFYSRSRQCLWEKGETSGHTLRLAEVRTDCDRDTLLVTALPAGPVCHLGTVTCFGDDSATAAGRLAFLDALETVIA
ncbi:MAG: phosphoribosyl-AMP cyclohydrolase, partial [Steroidobacteraceae bacterium]